MQLELDNAETRNGLQLFPGSHGMNVPSTCTIVIIAGKLSFKSFHLHDKYVHIHHLYSLGKYLGTVDRVMTQVDRITEAIDQMPVAAFIFRDNESDEVHFSFDIRYQPS